MISILSIGSSKPAYNIKEASYTALNPEYISRTNNSDVSEAVKNNTLSTTELAHRAAIIAIEKAGITKEQIGLVLADCATPLETIPGESQRVACMLGIKVPAFDIISGSSAIVNFMQSLISWKAEKLPEYILCLSVNSLTQRIDYSKGAEQGFFTDAAGAFILSTKRQGKIVLKEIMDYRQSELKGPLQINLFGHIKVDQDLAEKNYQKSKIKLTEYLKSQSGEYKILTDLYPFAKKDSDFVYPGQANSLGSGLICCLSENWDKFRANDIIILYSICLETMGAALIKMEINN